MATPTQDAGFSLLKHKIWEDGASMILGLLVVLSPWLSDAATSAAMMTTTGLLAF